MNSENIKVKNLKTVLCTVPQDMNRNPASGDLPITPNIAIVALVKWMSKFGYTGEFYDIDMLRPSQEDILSYFSSKKPDVVGLSAVVSTSYAKVKEISGLIRKASPSTLIVVGGNMAVSASVILNKTGVNICILGDGEDPWAKVLDYAEKNQKRDKKELLGIKGLAFLNDEGEMEFTGYGEPIESKENPFPDYELMSSGLLGRTDLLKYYFREGAKCRWFSHDTRVNDPGRKPNVSMLWTNKGCVGRCTFCQRFTKGYQLYDLNKLEDYLVNLKDKYNVQYIQITGENFGLPKDYAYNVARTFKAHDILWISGGVRCTSFNYEDMKYFKECGCTALKFGVESGSQTILNIMEKRFKVEEIYTALKNAQKAELFSPLVFCLGMPGETNQTIAETGRFMGEIAKLRGIPPTSLSVGMFYALPLPGAPLYEYGQMQGVIGTSVDEEEKFLMYIHEKDPSIRNYVNLNGINIKDAIFWEYMIYFEAMRAYFSSSRTGEISKTDDVGEINKGSDKVSFLKYMMNPVSRFSWNLIHHPKYASMLVKVPRRIIYPILRNLFYAEFMLMEFAKKMKNIGKSKPQKMKFNKIRRKIVLDGSKSLRDITNELRKELPPPATLTEKNQRILYQGR